MMYKYLSNEDMFKIIRPMLGDHILDDNMPIIHRTTETSLDINNMVPTGIQNISTKHNNKNKLVLPFSYDKKLLSFPL